MSTLFAALTPAIWPAAVGLVLYWSLKRAVARSDTVGIGPSADMVSELDWDHPFHVFRCDMQMPTIRQREKKLTAKFFLCTLQRIPEGTKVVEWSVKINFAGRVLPEWNHKTHDVNLASVGTTELTPTPELQVELLDPTIVPTVTCEIFCLVRVPDHEHDVKVIGHTYTQVCMLTQ